MADPVTRVTASTGEAQGLKYFLPETVAEATTGLADHRYLIIAGGTDIYPARADCPVQDDVMDISALGDLRGIHHEADVTRIGALATWTDVVEADLPPAFRGLQLAAREVGALQIQNAGTVVGNICNASPAADGVPPLLTLNAEVEITSVRGKRFLPLAEFILGNRRTALQPDEMVTAILVSRDADTVGNSHFLKLGSREYLVISFVMVATMLTTDSAGLVTDARVAVGACSEVACRLPLLEAALTEQPADQAHRIVTADHLQNLSPISDIRASKDYRMDAALTCLRRSLAQCAEGLNT